MRFFLKLVELFINIFGRRKKTEKKMGNISKDNYPMF
jgi:hypothetical protein